MFKMTLPQMLQRSFQFRDVCTLFIQFPLEKEINIVLKTFHKLRNIHYVYILDNKTIWAPLTLSSAAFLASF